MLCFSLNSRSGCVSKRHGSLVLRLHTRTPVTAEGRRALLTASNASVHAPFAGNLQSFGAPFQQILKSFGAPSPDIQRPFAPSLASEEGESLGPTETKPSGGWGRHAGACYRQSCFCRYQQSRQSYMYQHRCFCTYQQMTSINQVDYVGKSCEETLEPSSSWVKVVSGGKSCHCKSCRC